MSTATVKLAITAAALSLLTMIPIISRPVSVEAMELRRNFVDVWIYKPFRHGAPIDWEDVCVPSREKVCQRLLIAKAENAGDKAVILMMGGKGKNLTKWRKGKLAISRNFLTRSSPLLARAGFITAMTGLASDIDKRQGMSDEFRTSREHHRDISAAVEFLASEGAREIYLIGTSRGTLSVAYLATVMTHPNIEGYVLTASMNDIVDHFHAIKLPVLMVHNIDDECPKTTHLNARAAYHALNANSRNKFITLSGGDIPISKPCQARSYHGFLGIEHEAVSAIVDWMSRP